jgi:rhamnogalacturonan endolyase
MEIKSGQVPRRAALGLFGAAAATAVWSPNGVAWAAEGADVELLEDGNTVTLRNAKISITLDKTTAQISSILLVGSAQGNEAFNLVSGTNGRGYPTFDYHLVKTRYSKGMAGASYRVVSQTPDRVEIAMTVDDGGILPFYVETHMALERDVPGFYLYMIYKYTPSMPDGLTVQQLRYAVAAGDPSFTYFVVDDKRGVQQRPTIADSRVWTTLQDTTYALPDGSIYSKYQNITDLEGDSSVFMISNGKVGMSVIQASKEAFAGGPTKQELTAHDYYDGEILLWHPFTSHYGSPQLVPDKGWQKIYGPFLLYVNEAAGSADPAGNVRLMWENAKKKARQERAKWPYRWVSDPLYAAESRSTVSGKLTIAGHVSAERAWIVLSPPEQDWQYHNTAYAYSARTDERGRFAVKAVRPGTYTLTAFVDGVLGEYKKEAVTVGPGADANVGNLVWRPATHGRTLWQIGTPNRSAAEFHVYGGPAGFRKYLTWLEYPYEFPDGVDFTVGTDDVKQKWNYFQPAYKTPGTDLQLRWRGTAPDRSLTTWKIRFDSKGYAKGTGTLDIALASSVFGTLKVALNGVELASVDPLPGPPGDNASYRLSYRGMYRQLAPMTFPATMIKPGENVITLQPVRPPKAPLTQAGTVDDWMEPMAGIMYDVIRLQVDC